MCKAHTYTVTADSLPHSLVTDTAICRDIFLFEINSFVEVPYNKFCDKPVNQEEYIRESYKKCRRTREKEVKIGVEARTKTNRKSVNWSSRRTNKNMHKSRRCWEMDVWRQCVSTVSNDCVTSVENFGKRWVLNWLQCEFNQYGSQVSCLACYVAFATKMPLKMNSLH